MTKMRALVKSKAEEGLWMEEVDVPAYGGNDVLIKVTKNAICGTDVHIYKWNEWAQRTVPVPLVIGHEFTGVVEAVGSNVKTVKPGQRVSGEGHFTCGRCRNCRSGRRHLCANTEGMGYHRPGTFAEYAVLPEENIYALSDEISDDVAALLDPLGNAVFTALSFPLVGEDVLIAGAGPMGLMAAAVARHAGARNIVITDVNSDRLELARQMGATAAINVRDHSLAEIMPSLDIPHGFTRCMEMSGKAQGLTTLMDHATEGATIAQLGILPPDATIDWDKLIFKQLTLQGIWGRKIFNTWYTMEAMLQSGLDITPVITHRLPIEEFEEGFQSMMAGTATKVLLEW